jgi:hypothetical protein
MYAYTGNPFFYGLGPYTTDDRVTGSFVVANRLIDTAIGTDFSSTVLDYSFSDGVQILTPVNSTFSLILDTDSAGEIISSWTLQLSAFPTPVNVEGVTIFMGGFIYSSIFGGDGNEYGMLGSCLTVTGASHCTLADDAFYGTSSDLVSGPFPDPQQRHWSISSVPEPTALLLLGISLAALARWQRHNMRRPG